MSETSAAYRTGPVRPAPATPEQRRAAEERRFTAAMDGLDAYMERAIRLSRSVPGARAQLRAWLESELDLVNG